MIKLIVCETSGLSLSRAAELITSLPELYSMATAGCDDAVRDNLSSYIALKLSYERLGLGELPEVYRSSEGRPVLDLKEKKMSVSISHRRGVSLIGISDEGAIGVDVEIYDGKKDMLSLIKRFAPRMLEAGSDKGKIELYFSRLSRDGSLDSFIKVDEIENKSLQIEYLSPKDDPYCAWVGLESVLKLEGGGFDDLDRLDELLDVSTVCSLTLSLDERRIAVGAAYKDQ
ncbi:MAG: hypothetical protein IKC32_02140 [Clostridia bacterium]|nr:hypothetical protein [Clostridia bacterium]